MVDVFVVLQKVAPTIEVGHKAVAVLTVQKILMTVEVLQLQSTNKLVDFVVIVHRQASKVFMCQCTRFWKRPPSR